MGIWPHEVLHWVGLACVVCRVWSGRKIEMKKMVILFGLLSDGDV